MLIMVRHWVGALVLLGVIARAGHAEDCDRSCPAREQDSGGCCPLKKQPSPSLKKRPPPPPNAPQLAQNGRIDEAIEAATASDAVTVAGILRDASHCPGAIRVLDRFPQLQSQSRWQEIHSSCAIVIAREAARDKVDAALSRANVDAASVAIADFESKYPDDASFAWRAARIAAMRHDCATARALESHARAASVEDTNDDTAAIVMACAPKLAPVTPPFWTVKRELAVGVTGGGLVGLAAGIVLGVQARNRQSEAFRLCPDKENPCTSADHANELLAAGRQRALAANITFGVAAAAGIAAGVLWFAGAPESSPRNVGVAPAIESGNAIVVAFGRF